MIQRQKMGKEKKRKTLSQEFTLLTVVTSVGTLFLLGVVLISVFSFLFLQNAKEDMQYVLDSTNEQIQSHIQFISDGAVSIRHNPLLEAFLQSVYLLPYLVKASLLHKQDLHFLLQMAQIL